MQRLVLDQILVVRNVLHGVQPLVAAHDLLSKALPDVRARVHVMAVAQDVGTRSVSRLSRCGLSSGRGGYRGCRGCDPAGFEPPGVQNLTRGRGSYPLGYAGTFPRDVISELGRRGNFLPISTPDKKLTTIPCFWFSRLCFYSFLLQTSVGLFSDTDKRKILLQMGEVSVLLVRDESLFRRKSCI